MRESANTRANVAHGIARIVAVPVGCAAALTTALLCAGAASAGATTSSARAGITVFTVATGVSFINTADDRARGAKNNPFDAATNRLRPKVKETGNGPFPGDVAVFSFDVFPSPTLRRSIGSASYTCYFNYAKHALCKAYYELDRGTLTAAGPVDFNKTGFRMVVTGGTKSYLGIRGQVSSVQAKENAQRVSFELLD
jgi:hypothetical protein